MTSIDLINQAERLLKFFIEKVNKQFPQRIVSIFKLGSLGKQGDFSRCSDIDVALMLDEIKQEDYATIQYLVSEIKVSGLDYADRLSIFWSAYASDNFKQGVGRFPPLDRLNLLQCGILIYGLDKRKLLPVPEPSTIILTSAEFLNDFLLSAAKFSELTHAPAKILTKGARYFTKFVLFPVRLLFTLDKPNITASNKQAVEHFIANANDATKEYIELIQCAYRLRNDPANLPVSKININIIQVNLPKLYLHCIKRYLAISRNNLSKEALMALADKKKKLQAI